MRDNREIVSLTLKWNTTPNHGVSNTMMGQMAVQHTIHDIRSNVFGCHAFAQYTYNHEKLRQCR